MLHTVSELTRMLRDCWLSWLMVPDSLLLSLAACCYTTGGVPGLLNAGKAALSNPIGSLQAGANITKAAVTSVFSNAMWLKGVLAPPKQ